jgi:hypothetical protein
MLYHYKVCFKHVTGAGVTDERNRRTIYGGMARVPTERWKESGSLSLLSTVECLSNMTTTARP